MTKNIPTLKVQEPEEIGVAQDTRVFARIDAMQKRKSLAQPEQEPVAWGFQNTAITGSNRWMMLREEIPANDQYGGALWTPLYTSPPKRTWVGLTEDQFVEAARLAEAGNYLVAFQRIQQWLKEGNT